MAKTLKSAVEFLDGVAKTVKKKWVANTLISEDGDDESGSRYCVVGALGHQLGLKDAAIQGMTEKDILQQVFKENPCIRLGLVDAYADEVGARAYQGGDENEDPLRDTFRLAAKTKAFNDVDDLLRETIVRHNDATTSAAVLKKIRTAQKTLRKLERKKKK